MRSTHVWPALPAALVVLVWWGGADGQTPGTSVPAENPYPYRADEPKAKWYSASKSAEYLDGVARFWMRPNSCGACHANFAYLMARPMVEGDSAPLLAQTRQFLETRKPHPNFSFHAEAVGIAFALAWDDARTGGRLRPATRQALKRMWSFQRPQGMWSRMGCGTLVPAENDFHYTAVLAALAAGVAPEGYARTAEVQDGLTRLRRYFTRTPPRNLHHQALLLWASLHLDGLMTAAERQDTVRALLASQRADGGWSFDALSATPSRPAAAGQPSDGYGTALAVYVLRQADVPATRWELVRGADWLRSQQRASGRWFTPSHTAGDPTEGGVGTRDLYVQNLGTAFGVLALKACEGTESRSLRGLTGPGLSLRGRLIAGQ
jgi:squalene-hopene/tetraprenyl-beta-curcumene cyclase